MKQQNFLLVLGVVLTAAVPLFIVGLPEAGAEPFSGTDAQATQAITALAPDYKPWFSPVWEPPSGEIESLLFALQAAFGAAAIAYCIGYYRGLRRGTRNDVEGN